MNVLSLFDGMSCGQQALDRLGIKVDNYFASEIDKYAIQVTMANYPNTIQLGSVVDVDGYSLPKIDLLIGGSPCQSFSFAGKRKGMSTKDEQEILTLEHYLQLKSEGYEFEGQSYLFWEYIRLLNEVKPKYFLLENVMMGEKWEKVLSKAIGVKPIEINSALVSAQNRRRLYWTNIGMESMGLFGDMESIIKQPKDKGILLKDILEEEVNDKYFLSENHAGKLKNLNGKSSTFTAGGNSAGNHSQMDLIVTNNKRLNETIEKYKDELEDGTLIDSYNKTIHKDKSITISARVNDYNTHIVHNMMQRSGDPTKGGTGHLTRSDGKTYCLDTQQSNAVEIIGLTEVRTEEAKKIRRETGTNPKRAKKLVHRTDGKTGTLLTSPTNDNLIEINAIMLGRSESLGNPEKNDGKSYTLCKEQPHGIKYNSRIRRLTPIECERLQTVADNYTNYVSDSQRYKMLGNGWTVDVIAHIFSYMK